EPLSLNSHADDVRLVVVEPPTSVDHDHRAPRLIGRRDLAIQAARPPRHLCGLRFACSCLTTEDRSGTPQRRGRTSSRVPNLHTEERSITVYVHRAPVQPNAWEMRFVR